MQSFHSASRHGRPIAVSQVAQTEQRLESTRIAHRNLGTFRRSGVARARVGHPCAAGRHARAQPQTRRHDASVDWFLSFLLVGGSFPEWRQTCKVRSPRRAGYRGRHPVHAFPAYRRYGCRITVRPVVGEQEISGGQVGLAAAHMAMILLHADGEFRRSHLNLSSGSCLPLAMMPQCLT